jgi:hypothetical protein
VREAYVSIKIILKIFDHKQEIKVLSDYFIKEYICYDMGYDSCLQFKIRYPKILSLTVIKIMLLHILLTQIKLKTWTLKP